MNVHTVRSVEELTNAALLLLAKGLQTPRSASAEGVGAAGVALHLACDLAGTGSETWQPG
jgi:hypothetical protein